MADRSEIVFVLGRRRSMAEFRICGWNNAQESGKHEALLRMLYISSFLTEYSVQESITITNAPLSFLGNVVMSQKTLHFEILCH
jgi:hypothetical protein